MKNTAQQQPDSEHFQRPANQSEEFESALYIGNVRHRRFRDTRHEFDFSLFMMLLKLDEIPTLAQRLRQFGFGAFSWARFRRNDYLGEKNSDLQEAVIAKIAQLSGQPVTELQGDVFLLCQLRYLGFYFSPLNVYYLRQNGKFTRLLPEVSNTPWNERHYYLLDIDNPQPHAKAFHVSPFNPMQQNYHWRIRPPEADTGRCTLHLACVSQDDDQFTEFDATLALRRHPLNQKELTRVLLRTPAQSISVVAGIYWQALKLFLKRTPVYRHPRRNQKASKTEASQSRTG